jgi:hypothetical protein
MSTIFDRIKEKSFITPRKGESEKDFSSRETNTYMKNINDEIKRLLHNHRIKGGTINQSLIHAVEQAHKDRFFSKAVLEKYKEDIANGNTKAIKDLMKRIDYEFEDEDAPVVKEEHVHVKEEHVHVKETKVKHKKEKKVKVPKKKLEPVSLKTIGHELNTRTRKEELSPEKKREIYDYVMKF